MEPRDTDSDRALAAERYRVFREEGYEPLKTLRAHFNYHFIAADGSIEDVRGGESRMTIGAGEEDTLRGVENDNWSGRGDVRSK